MYLSKNTMLTRSRENKERLELIDEACIHHNQESLRNNVRPYIRILGYDRIEGDKNQKILMPSNKECVKCKQVCNIKRHGMSAHFGILNLFPRILNFHSLLLIPEPNYGDS